MSYSCDISFKKIAPEDVYDFLISFKKEVKDNIVKIAEGNKFYCKAFIGDSSKEDAYKLVKEWANLYLFKYRYFYNRELGLLGIYSVSSCLYSMFDCTVCFQNSTDRDYGLENWLGVDYFKRVFYKWSTSSDKDILDWYSKEYDEQYDPEDSCDIEYYRRTAAYEEIWGNFSHTLYNDDSVVYLGLFGGYDYDVYDKIFKVIYGG